MRKFKPFEHTHSQSLERIFSKMNDKKLDNKIRKDAAKVKKDLQTLVKDRTTRLSRYEDSVLQTTGKTKDDLTTWVVKNISQLSKGFEKLTGDARETMADTTATVKKDVWHGLRSFNGKSQEVADTVPGGFGKNAARYPWVAISLVLVVGFLLGGLIKPARQLIR